MTPDEAQAVLDTIRVPGWRFYIEPVGRADAIFGQRYAVHVQWAVPNAYGDGEWLHDEWGWFDADMTREQLLLDVYCRTQFRVLHEHSHVFEVDGEAIFDQHRNPASIARTRFLLVREQRGATWAST